MALDRPTATVRPDCRYLLETAPYCPTVECYVHSFARGSAEHHVDGCPMADTVYGRMHLLGHEFDDARRVLAEALTPALDATAIAVRRLLAEWEDESKRTLVGRIRWRLMHLGFRLGDAYGRLEDAALRWFR